MADEPGSADRAKKAAAEQAVRLVERRMKVGLGTGSTAAWFVRMLAERSAREDLDLICVATSNATAELARDNGLTVVELAGNLRLDLTVDGADEVDDELRMIKGGGAALLREKIVACASDRMVAIADASKRVPALGAFPLPVEVVRFGWEVTRATIGEILADAEVEGREITLRMAGEVPLVTDEGHYILDLHLKRIGDPEWLATTVATVPGVVEHGLFLDIAERAILGHADGTTAELSRGSAPGTGGRGERRAT